MEATIKAYAKREVGRKPKGPSSVTQVGLPVGVPEPEITPISEQPSLVTQVGLPTGEPKPEIVLAPEPSPPPFPLRPTPAPPDISLEEAYAPGVTGRAATEHAVQIAQEVGYEEKNGRIVSSWKAVQAELEAEGWSSSEARALAVSALSYLTPVGERRIEKPDDKFVDILGEKYLLQQRQFASKYGEAFGAGYEPHEAPAIIEGLGEQRENLLSQWGILNQEKLSLDRQANPQRWNEIESQMKVLTTEERQIGSYLSRVRRGVATTEDYQALESFEEIRPYLTTVGGELAFDVPKLVSAIERREIKTQDLVAFGITERQVEQLITPLPEQVEQTRLQDLASKYAIEGKPTPTEYRAQELARWTGKPLPPVETKFDLVTAIRDKVSEKDLVALGLGAGVVGGMIALHKKGVLDVGGEFHLHKAVVAGIPLSTLAPLGVTEKQYEEAQEFAREEYGRQELARWDDSLPPPINVFFEEYEKTHPPPSLMEKPTGMLTPEEESIYLRGGGGVAEWYAGAKETYEKLYGEGEYEKAGLRRAASWISPPFRALEPTVPAGEIKWWEWGIAGAQVVGLTTPLWASSLRAGTGPISAILRRVPIIRRYIPTKPMSPKEISRLMYGSPKHWEQIAKAHPTLTATDLQAMARTRGMTATEIERLVFMAEWEQKLALGGMTLEQLMKPYPVVATLVAPPITAPSISPTILPRVAPIVVPAPAPWISPDIRPRIKPEPIIAPFPFTSPLVSPTVVPATITTPEVFPDISPIPSPIARPSPFPIPSPFPTPILTPFLAPEPSPAPIPLVAPVPEPILTPTPALIIPTPVPVPTKPWKPFKPFIPPIGFPTVGGIPRWGRKLPRLGPRGEWIMEPEFVGVHPLTGKKVRVKRVRRIKYGRVPTKVKLTKSKITKTLITGQNDYGYSSPFYKRVLSV